MQYRSTRGADRIDFETALLSGLAPDGGLYMPEYWPQIDARGFKNLSYAAIADAVMAPFVEGSLDRADLRRLIDETYNAETFDHAAIAPLREIYPGQFVLELFHGPTLAFKDFALQFLGRLFDHVLTRRNEKITIVGATSGDTGSAAIEGCRHSRHIEIYILHPKGRVSEVQRRQMTSVDAPNVHNIAVEGTFDDCQALVKSMFADQFFRAAHNLSAVNSINWARIMAQIVYYFYAASRLPEGQAAHVQFTVPTGNFGNVFAGYAARRMGLPMGGIAIATNRNDILTRFFESGVMKRESAVATISPSMDIAVSSNFERYLFEIMGRDAGRLRAAMADFSSQGCFKADGDLLAAARRDFMAFRCDEAQTADTMRRICGDTGYEIDPHSAVGFFAGEALTQETADPVIALATAHPAKFPDAVMNATGRRPALPDRLADLMQKPERFTVLPNDLGTIQDFINNTI